MVASANEYLTRTWLIDPGEAEAKASKSAGRKAQQPWNGRDFYVSFGDDDGGGRSWEDARQYGFVSGGGGRWYSQTLSLLFPGARVFVNIPKSGYVGVGIVKETVVPVRDFKVRLDGKEMPILEAPLTGSSIGKHANDPEKSEYLVRIDWIKQVPKEDGHWEKGLFAVQHTSCRMRSRFTIERLAQHFGLED